MHGGRIRVAYSICTEHYIVLTMYINCHCGSKATELLQILVATIIDHCPSVYANKLKIARGIFPNGLAIIDDSRKLVVYSTIIYSRALL